MLDEHPDDLLQKPPPTSMCSSGVIVADAHDVLSLRSVGDTEHKVKAGYNRNLKLVLLPAANRTELFLETAPPPLTLVASA